jgi:hypothetical protein
MRPPGKFGPRPPAKKKMAPAVKPGPEGIDAAID